MNLKDSEKKVGENETKTEDRNDDQIWKLWHPHFSNPPKKTSYKKSSQHVHLVDIYALTERENNRYLEDYFSAVINTVA